ncbi:type II toxin-antitoxin system VapC family toxin [Rhodoblastus sp.]|uniref:type II toxin-antitoxin system VapC family toxin n=1 Tax=Rhodoblastus sp. TaxID=1962975 RepID=UPI003F987DD9
MNGFLLDSDIVALLSPAAQQASPAFLDWLERRDREGRLFLSVITVHEIVKSAVALERLGAREKAAALTGWLAGLVAAYDDRIISLDAAAAARAARLEAKALAAGHAPGMAAALVAGAAASHDLVIVARHAEHFLPFGVAAVSPEAATELS